MRRARRKQTRKLYAAGYLGTPQASGSKRHALLAVCNVVGAVGLIGLISYSFLSEHPTVTVTGNSPVEITIEKTRAQPQAAPASFALAGLTPPAARIDTGATGVIAIGVRPARVSTPDGAPISLRNTLVEDLDGAGLVGGPGIEEAGISVLGDVRRVVIGDLDEAAPEPVRVASIGPVDQVLPSSSKGSARGNGLSFGSLFRGPEAQPERAERGATPAPTPVPLTRRGGDVAVLVLSFAASPFGVRNIDPESRGDLMAAEEVARNSIEEADTAKDRRVARERYCLASAIYYEARGEPLTGQKAVAQVVLNRVDDKRYPSTICGVVFQNENRMHRCQFSFACDGKPERPKPGASWNVALEIAREFLSGYRHDEVGMATHYHADYVRPKWSVSPDMSRIRKIGHHIFYTES